MEVNSARIFTHFVVFLVFGETPASLSKKNCSSVTGTKREAILFLSRGEQCKDIGSLATNETA